MKFLYRKDLGIRTEGLAPLAQAVARLARVPLPRNAPMVGEGVFTHKAGIHIAGVLREPATYEPVPPGAVGNRRRFVLGKHSGRSAVRALLGAGGREPSEAEIDRLLRLAKGRGRKESTSFI